MFFLMLLKFGKKGVSDGGIRYLTCENYKFIMQSLKLGENQFLHPS